MSRTVILTSCGLSDSMKELLLKAYSNHNNITIILSDGTREEGNILFFDGEKISLSGKEFALSEIMEIANENAPHVVEESSNQESINTQDYSVFKAWRSQDRVC